MQTCIILAAMNPRAMLQALIETGQTQQEIAAAVGVAQSTINRLANGVTGTTDFETGKKIQHLYETLVVNRSAA